MARGRQNEPEQPTGQKYINEGMLTTIAFAVLLAVNIYTEFFINADVATVGKWVMWFCAGYLLSVVLKYYWQGAIVFWPTIAVTLLKYAHGWVGFGDRIALFKFYYTMGIVGLLTIAYACDLIAMEEHRRNHRHRA